MSVTYIDIETVLKDDIMSIWSSKDHLHCLLFLKTTYIMWKKKASLQIPDVPPLSSRGAAPEQCCSCRQCGCWNLLTWALKINYKTFLDPYTLLMQAMWSGHKWTVLWVTLFSNNTRKMFKESVSIPFLSTELQLCGEKQHHAVIVWGA